MRKKNCLSIILIIVFVSIFLDWAPYSSAKELIGVDKALQKIFRDATDFDSKQFVLSDEQAMNIAQKARINFQQEHSTKVHMYVAKNKEQILGYAFEDIVVGKWGPIHYLVGLNPSGTVLDIVILGYQEIRGRPIAKRRFLRQYKRKTIRDPVLLNRDINGITGATISSRSLTNGVRKLLYVFEEIVEK